MNIFKSYLITLFSTAAIVACGDDASTDKPIAGESNSYFVSAEQTATVSLPVLQSFAQLSGETEFLKLLKYAVTKYTIVYKTTFKGEVIDASGVLFIPEGIRDAAPLLSLQHGTEFVKSDAPSTSSDPTGMEYFASAGYIAFMPDFVGYGKSSQIFHPYYDRTSSAQSVIDMIKAVKEYLREHKIAFNDKLFLAGYSEGGYVTLAAAKEIDTNASHDLKVTAVAAGAGGYDLSSMLESVTQAEHYAYPSYLAFVLTAYNKTYDWGRPTSDFFNEPYAKAIDTYLNGNYSGSFLNSKLTTTVSALLNQDFYASLSQSNGELVVKRALADNSVLGWKTDIPILLYHGTADEIIPFTNSERTLQNFKSNGANQVSLITIPKGTHGSSFVPMLRDFVPRFETLR
ncbi:alpha/beta hydrolase family protein [Pseudochryseolinea flava]|uniref:Alpha/beta hydrolase n=1 Tax=Pseudochryseolinea flava TaxID=2059302 RepID=A0A364XY80_9BACT|nr:lipase family protein [Pseudochryseolinea flava]RAV99255.1 hypothetical protein DQQ10_20385 [Pseudochryseolinea flava]